MSSSAEAGASFSSHVVKAARHPVDRLLFFRLIKAKSFRPPAEGESLFSCVAKRKVTQREGPPAWRLPGIPARQVREAGPRAELRATWPALFEETDQERGSSDQWRWRVIQQAAMTAFGISCALPADLPSRHDGGYQAVNGRYRPEAVIHSPESLLGALCVPGRVSRRAAERGGEDL